MRFRIGQVEFGAHPQGRQGPIIVREFSPGGAELRVSDTDRFGRDGVMPGRDFLGAATWAFELSTNQRYASHAREAYSALQRIWHDPKTRGASGELVALDYEIRGTNEWRRVYGRPRGFDPATGDLLMFQGRADFGCEFEVMDPRFFSGAEQGLHEHTLRHVGELVGGWSAPFTFPLMSTEPVGRRQGALVNDGDIKTPVSVTFHGPVSNPVLNGSSGWTVGYRGRLRWDERVEIDPVRHTVTRFDGDGVPSPAAGSLSRGTQLSRIEIQPGLENVFFSGVDESHRSYAVVQWRDAHMSI